MNKPLDVHCEIDDGFALCGGSCVPRVPYDRFVQLGEALASSPPPRRYPWQRCPVCVAMTDMTDTSPAGASRT